MPGMISVVIDKDLSVNVCWPALCDPDGRGLCGSGGSITVAREVPLQEGEHTDSGVPGVALLHVEGLAVPVVLSLVHVRFLCMKLSTLKERSLVTYFVVLL